jgi:uncharacterized protein involved in exopolysaccharide biosynthesis
MENAAGRTYDEGASIAESIWRYWWLVVIATLLGGLAGYLWSVQQAAVYEAGSYVVLSSRSPEVLGQQFQPAGDPDRYLRNQAQMVTSPAVLARAAAMTDLDLTARDLSTLIQVEPSEDADVIGISIQHHNPQTAADVANAVASAYQVEAVAQAQRTITRVIDQLEDDQKELRSSLRRFASRETSGTDPVVVAEREATVQQLSALSTRVGDLKLARRLADGRVNFIEPADVPMEPVEPRPTRNAAVASLVAFLMASGLAWWLAGRRPAKTSQRKRAKISQRSQAGGTAPWRDSEPTETEMTLPEARTSPDATASTWPTEGVRVGPARLPPDSVGDGR